MSAFFLSFRPLRSLASLALALAWTACAEGTDADASSNVCGRGTPVWAAGELLCVYEQSVVIETGFSCPDGMAGQVNFSGVTVCGGAGLDLGLAGQAASQVDPDFVPPALPGAQTPGLPGPSLPGSGTGSAGAGAADAGSTDAGTADTGSAASPDPGTADTSATPAGSADAGTDTAGTTAPSEEETEETEEAGPAAAACDDDHPCADGLSCEEGACIEAPPEGDQNAAAQRTAGCTEDQDCAEGLHCVAGACLSED